MSESVIKRQQQTALVTACAKGNSKSAKLLLDKGVPVDSRDENHIRWTALMYASLHGHTDIVRMLLDKGAQVNLMTSVDADVVRILQNEGVQDFDTGSGLTALMIASYRGHMDVVKLLLDKNAHVDIASVVGWTALICASASGHTEVVKLLLNKGAQVNFHLLNKKIALIEASESGHLDVVKLLLDKGAQINLTAENNMSALSMACQNGHTDVIRLLLDKGANVNIQSQSKEGVTMTPLMIACFFGCTEVVKLLLEKGAEVNFHSNDGFTALIVASQFGHAKVVEVLLNNGADSEIDFHSDNEWTAVMYACQNGHAEVVKVLIDHGANIYIEDEKGTSALQLAADKDDIVSLLLGSGSNNETESEATSESKESDHVDDKSESNPEENEFKYDVQSESESDHKDENVLGKKLLAAIEVAIKEGGSINHVLFHGVFLGPPRSGKDSLMKRLVGEMPSDISPSTGAAEKVIHVNVEKSSTTAAMIMDNSLWTRLGYDEEAIQLMKLSSRRRSTNNTQIEICADLIQQETDSSMLLEHENTSKSEMQENKVDISCDEILERQNSPSQLIHTEPAKVQQIMPQRKHKTAIEIFKEAMKNEGFEGLQKHLSSTHSIYLTNTGGQMEFQELLPLLVSGPSVFLVTFQLHKSITETFPVVYELSDGQSSKSYQSSLSVLESILQTLSSIAAMGTHVYKGLQRKAVPLQPKVFIIGTHKDLLDQKSAKAEIERIDEHLQEVIKSTSHHYEGIIQFASESQMIFTVNNHDPDDLDFQRIRSAVENLAKNSEYRIRSPAHWMIFSLVVRQLQNRVETYDRCYAIAKECGIKDKEEFNQALHFIHTKMGLIRYFPHEELRNLVIVDPQVLFEKVTELIVETFTFEKASSQISLETFKQMGIFSLNDLERSGKQSDQKLTPVLFAELLGHLRIAARFKQDGVVKFFLPCALAHATEKHADHCTDIPKLLVTFKCGHCPKGLPGSLITYLMTNEMKSKFEWELMTKQIYRNEVSFQVGPHDTIILRIQPTHLEITCIPILSYPSTKRICTVEQVCKEVRHSIDTGIKTITSAINYVDAKHSFTFYCTLDSCSNHPHPAKAFEHKGKFGSLKCELKNQPVPLPSKYETWQFDSTFEERLNRSHVLYLICHLSNCAPNWREIGMYLGFDQKEMNDISAQPLLLNGAPRSWLFTLLSEWMEWAPGDYRGSTKYANLSDLKSAVSQAGFGVVAARLSLE